MRNGRGGRFALSNRLDEKCDTLTSHRMPATATIRELRNQFPKLKKLLEKDGEILVSDHGKTRYRLMLYTPPAPADPSPVDYWARLQAYHPQPLTAEQSEGLHNDNRGDR